jgi:hypothetical protein
VPEEETVALEPKVDSIAIGASLLGSFEAMSSRLSQLQIFTMKASPDSLVLLRIESRDMQKRPFLFFVFTFERDRITIDYTAAQDSSMKLRKLYVLRNLLSILSMVLDVYQPNPVELFQQLSSSVDDVLGTMSQSYSALVNSYDSIFNEYRELKRLSTQLESSNKSLTAQVTQISSENDELKKRLKELESYSDESLMSMIEDWIEAHENTIDVDEFSKNYKIVAPRVEQMLNRMVSLGYIELRG